MKTIGKFDIDINIINDIANEFTDEFVIINEVIANSYDANSKKLLITIDSKNKKIIFEDDGIGMNWDDAKTGFLTISRNKRNNENYLNSGRLILGRKGSGRIGLFSLASNIEIISKKENFDIISFLIDVDEILNNNKEIYELDIEKDKEISSKTGTKIILSNFKYDSIFNNLVDLKLSIYDSFNQVMINKKPTTEQKDKIFIKLKFDNEDQELFPKINKFKYIDRIISTEDSFENEKNIVKDADLKKDVKSSEFYDPNLLENKNERIMEPITKDKCFIDCWIKKENNEMIKGQIKINKGWLGTFSTIANSQINENNNQKSDDNYLKNFGIKLYSRNRMVIKDIRPNLKIDRFYNSYLCGEIFCDDLDSDEYKDITKLSRDSYGTQDERFKEIVLWVKNIANSLIGEKTKISKKSKNNEEKKTSKNIKNFMDEIQNNLQFDNNKREELDTKIVKKYKIKMYNDKKIIFISHKFFHLKETCKQKDVKNHNNSSYLMSLFIYRIYELLQENKIISKDINLIFTSAEKAAIPNANNIHYWIRDNAFDKRYYENILFYASIGCSYIENWNTDIEFGAGWFVEEINKFILVDPKFKDNLPLPIVGEIFEGIILEVDEKKKLVDLKEIINKEELINKLFLVPLKNIEIDLKLEDFNKLFKENHSLESFLYEEYKKKENELLTTQKYMNKKNNNK